MKKRVVGGALGLGAFVAIVFSSPRFSDAQTPPPQTPNQPAIETPIPWWQVGGGVLGVGGVGYLLRLILGYRSESTKLQDAQTNARMNDTRKEINELVAFYKRELLAERNEKSELLISNRLLQEINSRLQERLNAVERECGRLKASLQKVLTAHKSQAEHIRSLEAQMQSRDAGSPQVAVTRPQSD